MSDAHFPSPFCCFIGACDLHWPMEPKQIPLGKGIPGNNSSLIKEENAFLFASRLWLVRMCCWDPWQLSYILQGRPESQGEADPPPRRHWVPELASPGGACHAG